MAINFNPNLRKNDSLEINEIHQRAIVDNGVRTGDIEKALRTSGVSPSLSRTYAQSLKENPVSSKSDYLFEAALCEVYGEDEEY